MQTKKIGQVNFKAAARFHEDVPLRHLQEILTEHGIQNGVFDPRKWINIPIPRPLGEPKLLATGDTVRILQDSTEKGILTQQVKIPKRIYKVSEVLKAITDNRFNLEKLEFITFFQRIRQGLSRKR